jgi:Putative adhesin
VKNLNCENINLFPTCRIVSSLAIFVCLFAVISLAQPNPIPKPQPSPIPRPKVKVDVKTNVKVVINESDIPAEKSIQTDAKVNITLCVDKGRITINGWNRNEIRAFVSNGSQLGFKVLQKIKDIAVGVKILGFDPQKTKETNVKDCLTGEEIELDVPNNSIINLKARESETLISNLAKVRIDNSSGNITLRKISNGIEAKTYEGNISVGDSGGAITLNTTSGNILTFDVLANEIGDIFKTKTESGAINLKNVNYTQVEVNSTSGSIRYNGEFSNGGQFNFGTLNGAMTFLMPNNSSCKVNATYSFGSFSSEIPFKAEQKSSAKETQKLTAIFGDGDANVNLTTYSGRILIKKQ